MGRSRPSSRPSSSGVGAPGLAALKPEPCVSGLALAVLSLLVYWVGYRGNFYFVGYAGLHLLAASVVLWLWGWEHFKLASFAWFILGFAWPYVFLEDTLAFQLRYFMVGVTSWLLNLSGIATLQDGTSLVSAATAQRAQGAWFSLSVDGPCSGMRSLFALMMVSALYGYFRQRSFWRRALIFALSIPLAVLANMARILDPDRGQHVSSARISPSAVARITRRIFTCSRASPCFSSACWD